MLSGKHSLDANLLNPIPSNLITIMFVMQVWQIFVSILNTEMLQIEFDEKFLTIKFKYVIFNSD